MSRQINAVTPSSSSRRPHRLSLSRRRINFTTSPEALPSSIDRSQPSSSSRSQPYSSSRSQPYSSSRRRRRQERSQEQRVSEDNVQIIGNANEPLTRTYHSQGVTYYVHGQVNVSNDDPLLSQEDDTIEGVDRASQQISPRSPAYSPPYSSNDVLSQSQDLFDSPQSPQQHQSELELEEDEDEEEEEEEGEEVEVSCNICFTTLKDTKNVDSSFVTSIDCNHAVCFKCYVRIIMDNSTYKCFCSANSSDFRVYNKHGYVEFMPYNVTRNRDSIKQHWRELLENNTVNNRIIDLNDVERLERERSELRAKNSQVEHKMTMLNCDYVMLKHEHSVTELKLKWANRDLEEFTKKTQELQSTVNDLQEQLRKQVAESQAKFSEFERRNSELVAELYTIEMSKP
nr:immediate early protein 2 [Bombyx mori nucleopolyhedrovirus]